MILQDIRKYNAVYHKDCSLNWLEIGAKEGKRVRRKKTYPSIGLDKITVPENYKIDDDILDESRKLYAETGEMIPVYLSYGFDLIGGFEQYVLAKELGLSKIPAQRDTKPSKKELAKFRKSATTKPIANKKHLITCVDGNKIYISAGQNKRVAHLFKIARQLKLKCEIFSDFTVALKDCQGDYVVGSPEHGMRVNAAIKKINKLYDGK